MGKYSSLIPSLVIFILSFVSSTGVYTQSLNQLYELVETHYYEEADYMFEVLYLDNMKDSVFIKSYIKNLITLNKVEDAEYVYKDWLVNTKKCLDEPLLALIQKAKDREQEEINLSESLSPEEDEIFKRVKQMPRFPGCEDLIGREREKKKCAEEKIIQYLYKNLKYPAIARINKVEGTVVIQFLVDVDGFLNEIKVVKDIGKGCGEAALKVIHSMNDMDQRWTPGMQKGREVSVYYTLPVRFRLH